MNAEHINPFIESAVNFFSTMLGCAAERGKMSLTQHPCRPREVTALIGLAGAVRGTVALSFPSETAQRVVERLLGEPLEPRDDEMLDAVGEAVNIVAGGAKTHFALGGGASIQLSLPSVVRGNDYEVVHPSRSDWLEVAFASEVGPFSLRVSLEGGRNRAKSSS